MRKQISILSTKTLSVENRLILNDAHFFLLEEDFISVEKSNFELNNINENLIFTSQNAVQSILESSFSENLKSKNVFCVGSKTREFLEENGFTVTAFTGYAEDLAEIITLIYSTESFTFFSGNLRKETLPSMLTEAKVKWNEIKVYDTQLTPLKIKEEIDGLLFFSPSGVESYLKENKIKDEICFCIGNTTAEALQIKGVKNIIIAQKPTIANVIDDVLNKYK